jgi:transposase-like protein
MYCGFPRTELADAEKARVAALMLLRGYDVWDIAHELGVSAREMSSILQQVMEEWKEKTALDLDAHIAIELKKLELIEQQAWQAYETSRQAAKRRKIQERGTGATSGSPYEYERVEEESLPPGDPQYLEIVKWAIAKRIELLGLAAPKKAQFFTASVSIDATKQISSKERLQELQQLFTQLLASGEEGAEASLLTGEVSENAEPTAQVE